MNLLKRSVCCFDRRRKCNESCLAFGKIARPNGKGYDIYCKRLGWER